MSCPQLLSGPNGQVQAVQTSFLGYIPARLPRTIVGFNKPPRRSSLFPCIKCEKKDDDEAISEVDHNEAMRKANRDEAIRKFKSSPYFTYVDPISGRVEPTIGGNSSILGAEYWPEGTSNRARAARAPEPTGESEGSPSFGKRPGSRRKKYKTSAAASESSDTYDAASTESNLDDCEPSETSVTASTESNLDDCEPSGMSVTASTKSSESSLDAREPSGLNIAGPESFDISLKSSEHVGGESSKDATEEPNDISSEYVVYQTEEKLSGYDLDKKVGRPHPFINPNTKKPLGEPLPNEEKWWQWQKQEKTPWSRWQRRRPDSETVFLKAMAESGQIKLYGKEPTMTEAALYRSRRHLFKEERLQAERERLKRIGPIAYYSEWVKAWKRDTSREAVQKHYEETGEDETRQLHDMFCCQTTREYHIMKGTDIRLPRDPLAMRMREDQIKQIWGGDPVYPTINYIRDPNEVTDYRGPDFMEPVINPVHFFMEKGLMISREALKEMLERQKLLEPEESDDDDDDAIAMVNAVDIGEKDDEGDDSDDDDDAEANAEADNVVVDIGETEVGDDSDVSDASDADDTEVDSGAESEDEKLTDDWSDLKTTPELRKSKAKAKKPKKDNMTLDEAVDVSENLSDFLLDFEEEDE